jgi:hypothetical protein
VTDIVAQIKAGIPSSLKKGQLWHQRVTPEQKELLDAIASAWLSGELGHSARAVSVSASQRLREHGINIGPYGVREWLGELKRS